jgi:hypothetical protein
MRECGSWNPARDGVHRAIDATVAAAALFDLRGFITARLS